MFGRRRDLPQSSNTSFSKTGRSSSSFSKTHGVSKHRHEPRRRPAATTTTSSDVSMSSSSGTIASSLTPPIVTLVVGREKRIFVAHADVLGASPWLRQAVANTSVDSSGNKRIHLPFEEPDIFSSILEYLYRGDYYPRLVQNKKRNSWEVEPIEDGEARDSMESIVYHHPAHGDLLKDTVIYCVAGTYGLEELQGIALRKQGLRSGIQCSTILSSARFAYNNTPDTESKLRAHYLALIIRSRSIFQRSGTMQQEMLAGGTPLFFDLFVALCNHVDDISSAQ